MCFDFHNERMYLWSWTMIFLRFVLFFAFVFAMSNVCCLFDAPSNIEQISRSHFILFVLKQTQLFSIKTFPFEQRNSIIHNHFFDVIASEWWHPNLLRTSTLGWLRFYLRSECKRQKKSSELASHIWRDKSFVHSRRLDNPSTRLLYANNAQVSCNKLKCRHCSLFFSLSATHLSQISIYCKPFMMPFFNCSRNFGTKLGFCWWLRKFPVQQTRVWGKNNTRVQTHTHTHNVAYDKRSRGSESESEREKSRCHSLMDATKTYSQETLSAWFRGET